MRKFLSIVGSLSLLVGLGFYGTRAYSAPKQDSPPKFSGGQEEFDRIIHAREKNIVAQLGLSAEQKGRYDALSEELAGWNKTFRARRPHRPEEGMEINAWWNGSLQKVFTPQQYALYRQLWSSGPGSVAASTSGEVIARREGQALNNLKLTPAQRKKLAALQEKKRKNEAETASLNRELKSILTPKQYEQYRVAYSPARRMD